MANIYQEAIADAKLVRASALANAKAAIQEAFAPQVKEMFKKSMEESEEELDETEEMDEMGHHKHMEEAKHKKSKKHHEEDEEELEETKHHEDDEEEDELEEGHYEDELDETTLDEILAELDEESEEDDEEEDESKQHEEDDEEDELDEAKHHEEDELDEHYYEDELDEAKEEEEEEEEDGEKGEHAGTETKVVDITLGDLVDALKSAMASEHGEEAGEEGGDDISLDEVLDEMDEEEEDELDETKHKHYKHMEEAKKKKVDFAEPKGHTKGSGYGDEKREDKGSMGKKGAALKGAEKEAKFTPAHKELEEAKRALNIMRKELNEINLLNAKLLYTNKIFKSKSLSESQKVKVLSAFDRATTVKETKNVYNTLMESLQVSKKTSLKESYGFASKPAGNSPTKNMVESDPFVTRMQKLAGLI